MMPPRQEGPALAGGLCAGLQSFSPAFLAFTSVTVEKLQRLVPSFEATCASTEGVVRGPLSCLDVPRALATDDLIGINSNGRMASADGPIKTFPLRGIKDSPPYLHDGRLLTLEDTVEFFTVILELKLNDQEQQDVVAFLRAL